MRALLLAALIPGIFAAAAPVLPADRDRNLLHDAGLSVDALTARGWTPRAISSLTRAIAMASEVSREQHERFPSRLGDAFESGTLANVEEELLYRWARLRGRKHVFRRGCVAHQAAVFSRVFYAQPPLDGLELRRIVVGRRWIEHHAVLLFPEGANWETSGVVLDAWKNQGAQAHQIVFTLDAWKAAFWHIILFGPLRLEWSEFVAVDPFKL